MKVKHLVISILMIAVAATVVSAQQKPASGVEGRQPTALFISDSKSQTPEVKAEDLLRIRDLQFQQARRIIQQQQIARQYDDLQKEIDGAKNDLAAAVEAALQNAKVDRAKWDFSTETLKLVPRPPPPSVKDESAQSPKSKVNPN